MTKQSVREAVDYLIKTAEEEPEIIQQLWVDKPQMMQKILDRLDASLASKRALSTVPPLEQWVDDKGFRKLYEEIAVHAEMSDPKDMPRHFMIALRQHLEG